MQETIYLNREDSKKVEEEERDLFVRAVLAELELPELDEIWPEDHLSSIEDKVKLRNLLAKYNILILQRGRATEIYVEDDMIAIWREPKYRMLTDLKKANPAHKLFYEMTIDCESIFDEEYDEEQE